MPDLKRRATIQCGGIKRCLKRACCREKRILITGGGSGLGAAMGRRFVELGAELIICGRRLELLEETAAKMRGELGGKVTRHQMRHPRRRCGRCDDGCDLARGADRRARQQCRRNLHRADRTSVIPRRGRDPRADSARHDVLHARRRQALDRGQAQRRGAVHPLDLDHHRPRLHRAVGDGEDPPCWR